MKKIATLSSALITLGFLTACTASVVQDMPITDAPADDTPAAAADVPAAADADSNARVVDLSVGAAGFTPAVLTAVKGENLVLRFNNKSGEQSFTSPALGLDIAISEGGTKGFNIPTGNAGTFDFFSSTNPKLKGKIIIQ